MVEFVLDSLSEENLVKFDIVNAGLLRMYQNSLPVIVRFPM